MPEELEYGIAQMEAGQNIRESLVGRVTFNVAVPRRTGSIA